MTSITLLKRELMCAANNYKATHGRNADIRHLYVTARVFIRLLDGSSSNQFNTIEGYDIFVVKDERHPDYVICLR
jgi:hypothetical protein